MPTTYDPYPVAPEIVANHLLWLRREGTTTPMHILKLAYLSHGWMLALHEVPLITEAAEAWTYGPVFPSLYQRFKAFGGEPIDQVPQDNSDLLDARQSEVIKGVNRAYKDFEPWALSAITHETGTPWHIVKRRDGVGAIIPNYLIREHYEQLARKNDE